MSFPIAGPEPAAQAIPAEHSRRVEPLDCRALIDQCLTPEDWKTIFLRLRDADSVSAASLLLRFRFGLPHPDLVKDPPIPLETRLALPEWKHDLDTTPGTADEISPQPGE